MPQISVPDAPSVTPSAGAMPLQNINVSADSFGAQIGTALQGLGQSVGGLGDMAARHAVAFQQQANEADANQTLADHDIAVGGLMTNYQMMQGKQKADALPQLLKDLQSTRENYRGKLANPEAQRMFDQGSIRQFGFQVLNASKDAATAQRQYNSAAADARLGTTIDSAKHLQDDQQFDSTMSDDNLKKLITADPANQGKPPEVIDQIVREKRADAYSGRIQATAYSDPERAYKMLKDHEKDIDPTKMAGLQKSVENILITRRTADNATQVVGGGIPAGGKAADIEKYAMQKLSPLIGKAGAAGLTGGWHVESAGLQPGIINKGDGSDGSDSIGLGQWNSTRAANLKSFAAKAGTDWTDPKTQVDFAAWELQNYPPAIAAAAKLRNSQDPNEAAVIARAYYEVAAPATARDGVRKANAVRLFGSDISAQPVGAQGPGWREEAEKRAVDMANRQADILGFGSDSRANFVERQKQAVRSQYGQAQADYRDGIAGAKMTMAQALYPVEGDPPKNMDDFHNALGEDGWRAFNALPAQEQNRITDQITKNAVNPKLTEKGQAKYETYRGMLEDPETRPAILQNPEQIAQDPDLPHAMKSSLLNKAQQLKKDAAKAPASAAAMTQLKSEGLFDSVPQLAKGAGGPNNPNPAYAQFRGALTLAIEQYAASGKGQPDGPTVSKMGKEVLAAMTKQQSTWWGLGADKTVVNPDIKAATAAGMAQDKLVPQEDYERIRKMVTQHKGAAPDIGEIAKVYASPAYINAKQRAKANPTTPASTPAPPTQQSASAE